MRAPSHDPLAGVWCRRGGRAAGRFAEADPLAVAVAAMGEVEGDAAAAVPGGAGGDRVGPAVAAGACDASPQNACNGGPRAPRPGPSAAGTRLTLADRVTVDAVGSELLDQSLLEHRTA
jgi:hypothetical protein